MKIDKSIYLKKKKSKKFDFISEFTKIDFSQEENSRIYAKKWVLFKAIKNSKN